jgi:hypothetical protein
MKVYISYPYTQQSFGGDGSYLHQCIVQFVNFFNPAHVGACGRVVVVTICICLAKTLDLSLHICIIIKE